MTDTNETPKSESKTAGGCASIIAMMLLVGGVKWGYGAWEGAHTPPQVPVKAACEDSIKGRLDVPDRAKFSSESANQYAPTKVWTVTGSVDSLDLSGSPIEVYWTCKALSDGAPKVLSTTLGP